MLDCVDCHDGIKDLVHPSKLPPPNCAGCHDKEGEGLCRQHPRGQPRHGRLRARPTAGTATARTALCRSKTPASPVYKLNLPETCARCHSNAGLSQEYRMKNPQAAAQYMDSVHGAPC